MEAIDFIKRDLPDAILAKLDLDKVLSKHQVVEKVEALEPIFGGMAVHYDHSGKRIEVVWSANLQKKWEGKLVKGQKTRLVIKNEKGKILKDSCREGELTQDGLFWVGTDRCVYANFGKGSEAYDIVHLEPIIE